MIEVIVGALLTNHTMSDPEWRYQAGYVASLLEGGSPLPSNKALGGLSRIAGKRLLHRKQLIAWANNQARSLN
ncbi:MAG: hypothetical protein DRI24_17035 [Deltaproteobacteria bacterium]|nr:MAG: hypothetical protein DRI24_17035 [Deltaproteobacteria bacterium]